MEDEHKLRELAGMSQKYQLEYKMRIVLLKVITKNTSNQLKAKDGNRLTHYIETNWGRTIIDDVKECHSFEITN